MAVLMHTYDRAEDLHTAINTTPLVDVMMVLLIIFLITMPAITTSLIIDLPDERQQINEIKPEHILLSIDLQGNIYLFDRRITNKEDLRQKIHVLSNQEPPPSVQIFADAATKFESIGMVLQMLKSAGLTIVHFVTEPESDSSS